MKINVVLSKLTTAGFVGIKTKMRKKQNVTFKTLKLLHFIRYRSPVWGTTYLEIDWFVPKTGLQYALKNVKTGITKG